MTEGRCLCGAIRVTAEGLSDEISACFCDLCRRAGGGLQMGIEAPAEGVTVTGPLKVHRSSKLAERAWCDTCGSPVWFRYVEGPDTGYLELSPGLFDHDGGAKLKRIVYADRATGVHLKGAEIVKTAAQYEQENPFLDEGETP